MSSQGPPSAVSERWQELLDDADAIAAEYRDDGWETLVIQPGDVTPLSGEPFGLDVLAPSGEFEALEATLEAATFDTTHVYRAEKDDVRFFIIVTEAADAGVTAIVPAFLTLQEEAPLKEKATDEGVMYTHVHPLSEETRVTFSHDDPELFF